MKSRVLTLTLLLSFRATLFIQRDVVHSLVLLLVGQRLCAG